MTPEGGWLDPLVDVNQSSSNFSELRYRGLADGFSFDPKFARENENSPISLQFRVREKVRTSGCRSKGGQKSLYLDGKNVNKAVLDTEIREKRTSKSKRPKALVLEHLPKYRGGPGV